MSKSIFMTTTITGRNQITVPAQLVAKLGLLPGTRIEWLMGEEPDSFHCRVIPDPAKLAHSLLGAGRQYLRPTILHPLESLSNERADEDTLRQASL